MKRGIKRAGHEVEVAANLSEAKDLAVSFRPEALVSDLKLPDGTGLQLVEHLAIPFILMSGYADFDDAVAAIRLGCVDFFTKPVAIDDITARLENLAAADQSSANPNVCIDPGLDGSGMSIIEAQAHAFVQQDVMVQRCTWQDQTQARNEFNNINLEDITSRQLAAELMQSTDAGSLVINQRAGAVRLWLSDAAGMADNAQEDRLQFVQGTADTYICRENGVYVEYVHAS